MYYKRFLSVSLAAAAMGTILLSVSGVFENRKHDNLHSITREQLQHLEAYYERSVPGTNDIPDWLRELGCRHAFRDSTGNLLLVFTASIFSESGFYRFGGIAAPLAGVGEPRILRSQPVVDHWFSYAAD
jgi:hypothetical protein